MPDEEGPRNVEEEFRQLMGTMEFLKAQLESMYRQQELVALSIEDHERCATTMKAYKEMKEGDEILVPVGADSFVFAKLSSPERAVFGIGSGLRVEEGVDKGLERIERRLDEYRNVESQLLTRIKELEMNATAVQDRINLIYSQVSGE